jgi:hypothetical protein
LEVSSGVAHTGSRVVHVVSGRAPVQRTIRGPAITVTPVWPDAVSLRVCEPFALPSEPKWKSKQMHVWPPSSLAVALWCQARMSTPWVPVMTAFVEVVP